VSSRYLPPDEALSESLHEPSAWLRSWRSLALANNLAAQCNAAFPSTYLLVFGFLELKKLGIVACMSFSSEVLEGVPGLTCDMPPAIHDAQCGFQCLRHLNGLVPSLLDVPSTFRCGPVQAVGSEEAGSIVALFVAVLQPQSQVVSAIYALLDASQRHFLHFGFLTRWDTVISFVASIHL
jgi:hypothetical protein